MPDTGASQSIVSAAIARDANLSIPHTSTELRNASNDVMHLVGKAQVLMCNDKHSAITTYHSRGLGLEPLCSYWMAGFAAIACHPCFFPGCGSCCELFFFPSQQNLHRCFPTVWTISPYDSIPYRVSSPHPIPLRFQEPAHSEIANHIASGVIVPCDEPTD